MVTVCPSQFATRRTLFHVLEIGRAVSRNAETDLVCRLLLEKKKKRALCACPRPRRSVAQWQPTCRPPRQSLYNVQGWPCPAASHPRRRCTASSTYPCRPECHT